MTLTEVTRDYELLIRIQSDGTWGSHYRSITEILRDGEVVSATENPAVPLSLVAQQGAELLSDKLGNVATSALLHIEALNAEIAALRLKLGVKTGKFL